MEEEKDVKERVQALTMRYFTITKCPENVFQRFTNYARAETADSYAMALKQLLDVSDANAKELMLFQELSELKDRVVALENKPTQEEKPKRKTFGGE